MDQFSRTSILIGRNNIEKLQNAHVALFGVGGVGSFTAEALARAGVGNITLVDNDKVSLTNLNRQLVALHSTLGKYKTDVMANRITDINPSAKVICKNVFFNKDTLSQFDFKTFDYVIDAIDSVSSKLLLIEKCCECNVPVISCMGAGNKLDPTRFEVSDIYKTSVCPLAKVMRYELRKRNIKKLKVVYSKEEAISPVIEKIDKEDQAERRSIPGSISFVPSAAGLIIAGEAVKDLIK